MIQVGINILSSSLLFLLIGWAFTILYKSGRFFDLSQAAILTFSAYLVYWLSIQLNISVFFAIPVSIVLGIGIGLLIYQFIYTPLKLKNVESWQMLVASLGVYLILQNTISLFWGHSTLSFRTWPVKKGYEFLGANVTNIQIITCVVSCGLLLLSWLFLEKTNIGRKISAISSNPEMSSILGISNRKALLWSFGMGSGLISCSGILIAADTDMIPTMGFNWLLYGVVAMIIGGLGKIRYLLFGALLLAITQHLAAYYLDSKWMNASAYVILIVFLYFKPFGFSGSQLKKAEI